MPTRKGRERAERHQRIIDTARELAEAQGWDAVTIRRLAEQIEYSQPVLYSHFAGKAAIVSAVAEQGFADLAEQIRAARLATDNPIDALAATARAYLSFAQANPARYEAMFVLDTTLTFGAEAPDALRAAFGEIRMAYEPFASSDVETETEIAWSTLHGLIGLERSGRLRPELREQRLTMVLDRWIARPR